uniref:Uncharacterized protein n=1 Tax=Ralstonia solanacearum TaxID=305 RepID=A0A0S4U1X3_RALSL|nr:protein of unknown function [Ralstonia solanacearum]
MRHDATAPRPRLKNNPAQLADDIMCEPIGRCATRKWFKFCSHILRPHGRFSYSKGMPRFPPPMCTCSEPYRINFGNGSVG